MDLPEGHIKGIISLKDERVLNDQQFKSFISLTFDILTSRKTEDALRSFDGPSQSTLKIIYAAIVSLILEYAKRNTDPLEISEFLKQQKWHSERIEIFSQHYQKDLFDLRNLLSQSGFSFPHIVDVDWRLDYSLKKDTIYKLNKPVYTISLKIKEDGESKDITFTCTLEKLQDLVSKLQDATQSINRIDLS